VQKKTMPAPKRAGTRVTRDRAAREALWILKQLAGDPKAIAAVLVLTKLLASRRRQRR